MQETTRILILVRDDRRRMRLESALEAARPGSHATAIPHPGAAAWALRGGPTAIVFELLDEGSLADVNTLRAIAPTLRLIGVVAERSDLSDRARLAGIDAIVEDGPASGDDLGARLFAAIVGSSEDEPTGDPASAEREALLAAVSRELRSPIHVIVGTANTLLESELDAASRDAADTIKSSADRVMSLVADLLDYSQLRSGVLRLERTEFELRHLLDRVEQAHRAPARSKCLDLVIAVDERAPDVLVGDPSRVRLVLGHLLDDAIDTLDAGEVRLKIDVAAIEAEHVRLRFRIGQRGVSMADATTAGFDNPRTDVHTPRHRSVGRRPCVTRSRDRA